MGAIAGKLDFRGPVDAEVVERMCALMAHRGPDGGGVHSEDGVAIGARHLAVVDPANAQQPRRSEYGTVLAVMNGEIYNHDELRSRLLAAGHVLDGDSDVALLPHLYEDLGDRMVEALRGMFAFALWDRRRRRLLLGRDRVGKKPLFWARRGSRVWFASELRALLADPEVPRDPDPAAIAEYLALVYVPHRHCALRGIAKVAPASTVALTASGEEEHTYWSLDYAPKLSGTPDELAEQLREKLFEATRIRLGGSREAGAFVSGGIDSTAILAAMAAETSRPVKTFAVGFAEEKYDETGFARMAADLFGAEHHHIRVGPEVVELMPKLAAHYGEPFADPSALVTFRLAELAGASVSVALNGDGADGSFAGSPKYAANLMVDRLRDRVPDAATATAAALGSRLGAGVHRQAGRSRLARRLQILGMPSEHRYAMWGQTFDTSERRRALAPDFLAWLPAEPVTISEYWRGSRAADPLDRMLDVDARTYLPDDLMVKMDVATMAHSVEARSPFVDHHVMEFAAALPADLKLAGGAQKRLLKLAFRGVIPDAILDRPKHGFNVPLRNWFQAELRDLPGEVLLDRETLARGFLRREGVESMLAEHQAGAVDHSSRIWVLLQLEMWHREVLVPSLVSARHNR